ncbi:MAG: glycoside hydrolase family 65 protein [Oscillospiraceae bacterium]|nr:glycoside hydrolase family 65 protein [Oscillospiraceae bacterium]
MNADIWKYTRSGFDKNEVITNGNRFLIGNGFIGYRGTMDEWGKDELSAVNLAGIYDQNGDKWREPVNAPNGVFCKILIDRIPMALGETETKEHTQTIDFRRGVHERETDFGKATLKSERLCSMVRHNLIASRLTFKLCEDSRVEIITGIVTDIWDINGPHLFDHAFKTGRVLVVSSKTGELSFPVVVSQAAVYDFPADEVHEMAKTGLYRHISFDGKAGQEYTLALFCAVYSGQKGEQLNKSAEDLVIEAEKLGFCGVLAEHEAAWDALWQNSEVTLEGDDKAQRALNASIYHLHSIAPRHADNLSIPARGLSGQTYKGAIFWDTEIFLFPFFAHTDPALAKNLLRYRIETLPGALKKAKEYGFRGAFYAWESQEGGAEGCSYFNANDIFTRRPLRTYFRDKQIHVSGDIAYAMWHYFALSGDDSLLREGGAEVIFQVARFFISRTHQRVDNGKVELLDVVGPDEYHERVNNSVFTNQMAAFCLENTIKTADYLKGKYPSEYRALMDRLDFKEDLAFCRELLPKIKPQFDPEKIIEQFDGYFDLEDCSLRTVSSRILHKQEYWGSNNGVAAHTQIIKQADVVAMMALFPELFSPEAVRRNWEYYEPRTEHGSSLSACMYALTACRFGRADLAWDHFLKTASIDLTGTSKSWAGEIYIGGTHPAANAGAWLIAVMGFAGLSKQNGRIMLSPCLPEQITRLSFRVIAENGIRKTVTVTHEGYEIQ